MSAFLLMELEFVFPSRTKKNSTKHLLHQLSDLWFHWKGWYLQTFSFHCIFLNGFYCVSCLRSFPDYWLERRKWRPRRLPFNRACACAGANTVIRKCLFWWKCAASSFHVHCGGMNGRCDDNYSGGMSPCGHGGAFTCSTMNPSNYCVKLTALVFTALLSQCPENWVRTISWLSFNKPLHG